MDIPLWAYLILVAIGLAPIVWMGAMALRADPAPPGYPCAGCRNENRRYKPDLDCVSWCRQYKEYVRVRNNYIKWRRAQNLTKGEGPCPSCPQGQKSKETLPVQCVDCAMICARFRIDRREVA